jgi:hypothetical protein
MQEQVIIKVPTEIKKVIMSFKINKSKIKTNITFSASGIINRFVIS